MSMSAHQRTSGPIRNEGRKGGGGGSGPQRGASVGVRQTWRRSHCPSVTMVTFGSSASRPFQTSLNYEKAGKGGDQDGRGCGTVISWSRKSWCGASSTYGAARTARQAKLSHG